MTEENQLQTLEPDNPKKRGAPVGNQNAFKHGFYSRHYTRTEIKDLSKMEMLDLDNEIQLVRTLMRRVLESAQDNTSHTENIETLRAICLGNFTLARLIRTHFLRPKDEFAEFHKELLEIIAEVNEMQAMKNQEEGNNKNALAFQYDDSMFK